MSDDAPASDGSLGPVRAQWRFTETEVRAWVGITGNRSSNREPFDVDWTIGIMATLVSVAVQVGAFALGVVGDLRNPTVAILCFLAIYVVLWSRKSLVNRYWQRRAAEVVRSRCDLDYTFRMDETGVVFERPHETYVLEWAAVQEVTSSDGLLLFWTEEADGVPVPIRAIAEADRPRAFALAKTKGAGRGEPRHEGSDA